MFEGIHMKFEYNKTTLSPLTKGEQNCFLLTNGLGGYSSLTNAGTVARNDHALLMAAPHAHNDRLHVITNTCEIITINGASFLLSSKRTDPKSNAHDNTKHLNSFTFDRIPVWEYVVNNIKIKKSICMAHGFNTVSLKYEITAPHDTSVSLKVIPLYKMTKKNSGFTGITDTNGVYIRTNGEIKLKTPKETDPFYFSQDDRDGRTAYGKCFTDKVIVFDNAAKTFPEITFSLEPFSDKNPASFDEIFKINVNYDNELLKKTLVRGKYSELLTLSADAFIVRGHDKTKKTIIAGYPFFEDWGRDTFISIPGLTLATGRFEDCKEILLTFSKYEKNGLLPNLFPEGNNDPRYNTVDAPLLFINIVWNYYLATGDKKFAMQMIPVMKNIIYNYEKGTDFHIRMDSDSLIEAGAGTEQLTWMDVCVDGFLPTPRHGKPVEINAYWYSALCILYELTGDPHYHELSEKVKESFLLKFVDKENGYLKDVINGTAEENKVRCNAIWALTMPFTMIDEELSEKILDKIYNELFTTAGLRTLSPSDPDFHAVYIGDLYSRDTAYHTGTVWTYPLGAYYRAETNYIKNLKSGDKFEARYKKLKDNLLKTLDWLNEGCVSQFAEIYDGLKPTVSRGCFAQAWSTAEILYAIYVFEKTFNEEI